MEFVNDNHLSRPVLAILPLVFSLWVTGCSNSDDDDDSQGSADTTISISETFNVDAGASVLLEAHTLSRTNGDGIGSIITANAASPQPGNGYTASTIDIVNGTTNNTVVETVDFAGNGLGLNATAAQLAAFFETQSDYVDATATTSARLTLSTASIAPGDQFSVNGAGIDGNTRSEVMADIHALPNIVASINSDGVITVTVTNGDDLRLNLANASTGQDITVESIQVDHDVVVVTDSVVVGDGQPSTKATVGGVVEVTLEYPLQLANAGSGNLFGATLPAEYSEQNAFDVDDPETYNDAASVTITDSLGNDHELTQYFVRQDDLAGTQPNRWALIVMIDGRHVGAADTNGMPIPARFDIAFDSNGQLDGDAMDEIEISVWEPLDDDGNPNGADTARITIDITGSTQFGGDFSLTNVTVN